MRLGRFLDDAALSEMTRKFTLLEKEFYAHDIKHHTVEIKNLFKILEDKVSAMRKAFLRHKSIAEARAARAKTREQRLADEKDEQQRLADESAAKLKLVDVKSSRGSPRRRSVTNSVGKREGVRSGEGVERAKGVTSQRVARGGSASATGERRSARVNGNEKQNVENVKEPILHAERVEKDQSPEFQKELKDVKQ
eukprot:1468316-Rhodomonas_salina.1